jgi:hypothetical protein
MNPVFFGGGKHLIVSLSMCLICSLCYSQWTNSTNIYNTNSGNVGIGTTTPNFLLDVNGWAAMGGSNSNLGNATFVAGITKLQGTGKMIVGWNKTGGNGETDLVSNPLSGLPGGFGFYSYSSSGTWTNLMYMTGAGMVGIGTTTPNAQFESYTSLGTSAGNTAEMARFSGVTANYSQLRFFLNRFAAGTGWTTASTRMQAVTDGSMYGYIEFNPNGGAGGTAFGTASSEQMRILQNGNVLIGKTSQTNSAYLLDVNGNGRMNEVVVNTTGADYVFDSGYHLPALHEVSDYLRREHHLPGIASAAEMQHDGLQLGMNQTRLLAKVEELTLYLIEQDKKTIALEEKVKELEARNHALEQLEQRVERLEHAAGSAY